jgi:membrane protease YdiL (CAAX protease family)
MLSGLLTLPFLLMVPGPLWAAIIVTSITDGGSGVKRLLRKFTIWRVGWRWYLVALGLGPLVGLTATYVNVWFGAPDPTAILIAAIPSTLLLFATRLINPMDGPMQEELGWRGYALPWFQERYQPLIANLILGVIVAGWHLPWVWQGKLPLFALLGTIAYTIVAAWVCNNTKGSVLLPLITHAADGLIRPGFTGADLTRFYMLYVAAWWIVVGVILLTYGPSLVRKGTSLIKHTLVNQAAAVK